VDSRGTVIRFSEWGKINFSFLQTLQTSSGVHPASYLRGAWRKTADHSLSTNTDTKNKRSHTSYSFHIPSLRAKGELTLFTLASVLHT
jgi:hypothetical protein